LQAAGAQGGKRGVRESEAGCRVLARAGCHEIDARLL